MQKEVVTNNIQMLSAFSKPTNAWEIKPFVSKVLKEFNIEAFEGKKQFKVDLIIIYRRLLMVRTMCFLASKN